MALTQKEIDEALQTVQRKNKGEDKGKGAVSQAEINAALQTVQESAKPKPAAIAPPPKRPKPVSAYVEPGGMYSSIIAPNDFASNVAKATERNNAVMGKPTPKPGLPRTPTAAESIVNTFKPKPITIQQTTIQPANGKGEPKVETKVVAPSRAASGFKGRTPSEVAASGIREAEIESIGETLAAAGPQPDKYPVWRTFQQGILNSIPFLPDDIRAALPAETEQHPVATGAGRLAGEAAQIIPAMGGINLLSPVAAATSALKSSALQGGKRIVAEAGLEGTKFGLYGTGRGILEGADEGLPLEEIPGKALQTGAEYFATGAAFGGAGAIIKNSIAFLQGARNVSAARSYMGVSEGATDADLVKATRNLLRASHPDAGGSHEAFIAAQQAIPEAVSTIKGGRVTPGFWKSVFGEGMTPPTVAPTPMAPPPRQPIGALEQAPVARPIEPLPAPTRPVPAPEVVMPQAPVTRAVEAPVRPVEVAAPPVKSQVAKPKAVKPTVAKAAPVAPEGKQPWAVSLKDYDTIYPKADRVVDGRIVRDEIPNLDSIDSSVENPTEISGIREVPIAAFEDSGPPKFYSRDERLRTEKLAEGIKESGEISPLVVVYDAEGPYILEGGHRFDALKLLGAKSFPAKVVFDEDSLYEAVKSAVAAGKPVPASVLADYPDLAPPSRPVPKVPVKSAEPTARMEIKEGTFEIDATGEKVTSRQVGGKPVPIVPRKNAAVAKEAKKRGEATPAPEVNTPFRPAVSDFGEKNTLVTKSEADAALERVLRKTGRLSANIDPTVINDMAKVGAYYIEGGIRQFGDWAAKMRGHFGKDAEPYLRRIYTLSNGNISKLRKFPQSVKDAPIAPVELKEKIEENPPTYEPISNEVTLQAAQSRIDADVSGGHVTWRGIIAKQKMTAEDVAVGEDLIRRAINEGRIDEANLLTTELAEMLTQAGQTVQAASMIKRMTPEGMLVFAKRALDRANALLPEKAKTANLSDVDAARIVNLMKRKAELAVETDLDAFVRKYEELIQSKEFTPSQTKALRQILKRDVLDASDRDAALTAFRKRIDEVLTARVMQIIADAHPVTTGDRLRALQRISMLLNPKTVISRNVLGNVLMNAVTNFSETLALPIDMAVNVFSKKRTTTAPSLVIQGGAFAKGVRNVVDDIRLGVDTSPSRTQFELPQGRVFNSNFWNGLDQVVRRGLTFGDRPFYEAAYEEALRQYMRTNSLTEATVEAKEYATRVAQIKTYVDTNTISEAFEGLRNTLNGDPTGRKGTKFGFGNIVLPFTKTPANILARALDYSVGGAVRTARAAGLRRGGGFDQRAFVKNLSQGLTGAGLIIAGYTLASMGMLRGAPEKKKRKEQFLRATGKSPYSYYVGGYSYTYDWAQPASFLIAMGANMYQTGVSKEDATTRVTEAVISGGDTLFNLSVMQGLRGLVGYGSVVEGLVKTVADTPLQAVPTIAGQTARSVDSTMRMTYSPSELDSVMRKIKARVPFLSRTLQPRINIRGEKSLYAGGAFAQYLSPANIAKIEEGSIDKEILRLYAITGDSEVFPRAVQPRFSYDKKEYILTPEQYTKFQQLVGTTTYIGLARIFSDTSYKLNDEQERAEMAQKIVRAAYNEAKAHILSKEYGVTMGKSSDPGIPSIPSIPSIPKIPSY